MKKTIFIMSIAILVTASSCVTTLQPLVTYNTAITDNRLEGGWEQDGEEYIVQKVFNSDFSRLAKSVHFYIPKLRWRPIRAEY